MSLTREQARRMRRLSPTNWTPAQARVMGRKGGQHRSAAKCINLRLGPAAAVAARAEYRRLIAERDR